jgi:hypothetical protein
MRNGSCTPLWSTSYESLICQFVYDCDSQAESVFRCYFKVTKLSPSSRIHEYFALFQSGSIQHFVESKVLWPSSIKLTSATYTESRKSSLLTRKLFLDDPFNTILTRMCKFSVRFLFLRCFSVLRNSPTLDKAASLLRFLDHTHWHTTVGRIPLDGRSAGRRDLYLTTRNTHKRQTSIPRSIFKRWMRN